MTAAETYKQKFSRVKPEHFTWIGEQVVYKALDIFEACEATSDFCMQSCEEANEIVVFGGFNRVLWSLRKGFWASEWHCTEKFLRLFKEYEDKHTQNPGG